MDLGAYASIEDMVIATCVAHSDMVDDLTEIVGVDHFLVPAHRLIFEAIIELCSNGRRADFRILPEYLGPLPETEVGTSQYLARLAAIAPTRAQGMDYARELRERYTRWKVEEIAQSAIYAAQNPLAGQTAEQLVELVEQSLYGLNKSTVRGGFVDFAQSTAEAVNYAAKASEARTGLAGLSSGLDSLDEIMGGLQASDLIVLAARPGMGKTALATNVAHRLCRDGKSVGYFSLEMSKDQLATRILAEVCRVPSAAVRRGNIADWEVQKLREAAASIKGWKLHIDDQSALTLATIRSRARRLKRERGLDLLIIDYMQLMSPGTSYKGNRVQEISEISAGLKSLAKELNVPVLALSQLSRQVEAREDKRPLLSDLRESGSIEQDADVVLFVYREEYYLKMSEPPEGTDKHTIWSGKVDASVGKAEIIVAKQRHGPTGNVEVRFDATVTSFYDFEKPSPANVMTDPFKDAEDLPYRSKASH